ncbi:MAG: hypothetical protein ACRDAJ_06910 [Serratia fonticola]
MTSTVSWRPIESAPLDGTKIELLGVDWKVDVGSFYYFREASKELGIGDFESEKGYGPFTHWRPLK